MLTRRSDYGLIFLQKLASTNSYLSLTSVARELGVSALYLKKLAAPLKKAGLVESREGIRGGYRLKRSPQDISVGEIVRILEDGYGLTVCTTHPGACHLEARCKTRYLWKGVHAELLKILDEKKLGSIA